MKKSELADLTCSLAGALAQIGDAWSLMVIKELMLGNQRFEGIQLQTGMSSNSLTQRLKSLEMRGVVTRRAYQERPERYEYRLTEKGVALWPVLVTLTRWGDHWARRGGAPLSFRHAACGGDAGPVLACASCGGPMTPRDAEPRLSPGMQRERKRRATGKPGTRDVA